MTEGSHFVYQLLLTMTVRLVGHMCTDHQIWHAMHVRRFANFVTYGIEGHCGPGPARRPRVNFNHISCLGRNHLAAAAGMQIAYLCVRTVAQIDGFLHDPACMHHDHSNVRRRDRVQ